ncbi:hypothetical protein DL96DRAFT_1614751 [Flagelloscypha sp. PMI_526]|nr:hypothetical protein DL96DRAFT_1614751 [Flagelloscypha sp. PMI_526]
MHWHAVFRFGFSLVLPVIAAGYLAFCFVAYAKNPQVPHLAAISTTSEDLARVKAGITTLSIIVVAICLYPAKSLIQEIKSEEFWRILRQRKDGVPLVAINTVSTPAESLIHSLTIIVKGYCSLYFSASLVSGFIVIAASALAPSILSADLLQRDGDIFALRVGSLPQDVITSTNVWDADEGMDIRTTPGNLGEEAAISAYIEGTGRFQSQIRTPGPDGARYFMVPLPVDQEIGQSMRWISDIAAYRPSCTVARTNITDVLQIDWASNSISKYPVALPDDDLVFFPPTQDWGTPVSQSFFSRAKYADVLTQHGGDIFPPDLDVSGATVWYLSRCMVNCSDIDITDGVEASLEFTIDHPYKFTVHTNYEIGKGLMYRGLAALVIVCKPLEMEIQTRELHIDSKNGLVTFQPLAGDKAFKSQRNVDRTQAHLLFKAALDSLDKSGPVTAIEYQATRFELSIFFDGNTLKQWNRSDPTTSATLDFLPMQNVTENYASALSSAFRSYLAGQMGSTLVPARAFSPVIVFTASLPPLISSTILFFILSCLVFITHNRTGRGENFTLYTVAKALQQPLANQGSQAVAQNRAVVNKGEEEEVMDLIGNTPIMLLKDIEGVPVLFVDGEKLKRRNRLVRDPEVVTVSPRGSSDEQSVLLQSTSERTSEIEKSGQSSNT